jgi:hypothetical protein
MSRAIASARQRRAGIQEPPPPPQVQQQQQQQQGLTLPQVISVVDARLIKLEKFMNETQQQLPLQQQSDQQSDFIQTSNTISQPLIEEFQNRFDLLAQEIMNLKDIVLKLQSYTMDVNKILLEERTTVPTTTNGLFTMDLQSFNEDEDIETTTIEVFDKSIRDAE